MLEMLVFGKSWQIGLLDVVLLEYPDKSHNLTNLIFMTSSLKNSICISTGISIGISVSAIDSVSVSFSISISIYYLCYLSRAKVESHN